VLITSRKRLKALEDVQVISLDILPPGDAAALLVRLAGRAGLDPEDSAVHEITQQCGYLPLAIGMLARQLHHHPVWTPGQLADDLAEARDRLEFMQAENLSVAAAFDLSYRDLPPGQQRLFRRLGLHPGTEIDAYAAAALDDASLASAGRYLTNLYDAYLLTEPVRGRYRMHDLIAERARTLVATDEVADREAATDRLMGYYLYTSRIASRQYARRSPSGPPCMPNDRPAHAPDLSDPTDAGVWMDAEQANLHAATIHAASHDRPGYAIDIPAAVHGYLRYHGNWEHGLAIHHIALEAARRKDDVHAQASTLTDIGDIFQLAGKFPAATASLATALELHQRHGNQQGEANALSILGFVHYLTGDNNAARDTLTRGLELHRRVGDHLGQAGALAYLGRVQLATGDYRAAESGLSLGLELARCSGILEARLHYFLAEAQQARENYAAARVNAILALELERRIGNPYGEAAALRDLGHIQRASGDLTAAAESLSRALK
jgi:tetratricopeptide (TPR) repeat protein